MDGERSEGGSATFTAAASLTPATGPKVASPAPNDHDDGDGAEEDDDNNNNNDDTVPIVSQATGDEEDEDALGETSDRRLKPSPPSRKRPHAEVKDELDRATERTAKAR